MNGDDDDFNGKLFQSVSEQPVVVLHGLKSGGIKKLKIVWFVTITCAILCFLSHDNFVCKYFHDMLVLIKNSMRDEMSN